MTILVITTGGTIGALPYENLQRQPKIKTMPPKGVDLVREALIDHFGYAPTRCISMEPRDSNFIDLSYKESIVNLVKAAPETEVLITHGTDTILETANFFYSHPDLKNKIIIITGAVVALSCGPETDGYVNLEFSLKKLMEFTVEREQSTGIYIVLCDYQFPETQSGWKPHLYRFAPNMYEKVYDPEDSRRDRIKRIGT